jgi:ABC-2 type transport system permease protein
MSAGAALRPYVSLFMSRFQLMLQYRGAAFAGFVTQCWWGGLKVMILAAFYGASTAAATAPITLQQAITYTWVSQGLLAMLPWLGDPAIATEVRTGSVSYDRVRPLDFYSMWYSRAAGWIAARTAPRALMMFLFAAILMPLVGWGEWAWQPPAHLAAMLLFVPSVALALLLSAAFVMLINIGVAATLNARGINALINAPVVVFSGNLLPLSLFPDWMQTALLLQPFAGLLDIPLRIYFGQLEGVAALGGLALQSFWLAALVLLGRWLMSRVVRTLEMQGG